MILRVLLVWLCAVFSMPLLAADNPIYSHKKKGAIKGADVVAYYSLKPGDKAVIGSKDITHDWNGATWRFATEENRDLFAADPQRYAPQFGGYCVFAVSHDFTTSILPNSWSIIDDKLYLNHNRFTQRRFLKDAETKIRKAEENWPHVLTNCEAKDKCNRY